MTFVPQEQLPKKMRVQKIVMPKVQAERISASDCKLTGKGEKRSVWEELKVKMKIIFTFQLAFKNCPLVILKPAVKYTVTLKI